MQYAEQFARDIEFGSAENVLGLANPPKDAVTKERCPSNLDFCQYRMCQSFWSCTLALNPKVAGWPVSRKRLWMPFAPLRCSEDLGGPDAATEIAVDMAANMLARSEPTHLDDVLLKENDILVRSLLDDCCEPATKRARTSSSCKWVERHEADHADWLEMATISQEMLALYPGLRALSTRERDLIACKQLALPTQEAGTVDVSQQESRSGFHRGGSGCVTPSMRLLLTHLCRLTHGVEAIQMQGIHYGDQHHKLKDFPSDFLQNIAGNAFHMRMCAISLVAALSVVARAATVALVLPPLGRQVSLHIEEDPLEDSIWEV